MTITEEEGKLLRRRYEEYCLAIDNTNVVSERLPPRNNYFLCEVHNIDHKWKDEINGNCNDCIKYTTIDIVDGGLLFLGKDVMSFLLTKKADSRGKHVNAEYECASMLFCHWIHSNVYPMTVQGIQKRVTQMHAAYRDVKKYEKLKKTTKYWEKYMKFVATQNTLFDIKGDSTYVTDQEKFWGVTMTDDDKDFYEDQKDSRSKFCTRIVDPKWRASYERKQKRLNRSRTETYDSTAFKGIDTSEIEDTNIDADEDANKGDEEFVPAPPSPKKTRYDYIETFREEDDEFPQKYCYPRDGPHRVKRELYAAMHVLKSQYHMSDEQVEGSIVTIANMLFGRKWKEHCPNQSVDNNCLPSMSNLRRTERYAEVMILQSIVGEIMNDETKSCVVYSSDGSAQSGVGSYMVQSLTINGVQRTLPTLPIASESKQNLKDHTLETLNMLSASTGGKYSRSDIFEKIDFMMSDSTAHNLGVMKLVGDDLGSEHEPPSLLCNVHPLMMFQNKIKQLCQQIHDSIGKKKIKECFLVDVEFHSESFIIKAIKCLSNFINKECSSKPWNRSEHFSDFIKPKENMSISLKDHRFNRLNDCSLTVLYHLDDIAAYLEKFTSITNGISILDRSFIEMEILKPIFSAISLLGIHVTRPFHRLMMDSETNYSDLLKAYPKLYDELLTLPAKDVLQTTEQVFQFVSATMFKESLPNSPQLLESLNAAIQEYSHEILILVRILMKLFADGLHLQKGAIFGFGPAASEEVSQNVLKISSADESVLSTLDKNVQVHNIGEERNVGMINYELSIRGKDNLHSASRKVVINRSIDLMKKNKQDFRKFRKEAKLIEEIRVNWNEKMQHLQKIGFEEKDLVNVKEDAAKLKDLEFLKAQIVPGPFTKVEEVEQFMKTVEESKEKNQRLYAEVRYAKRTCLSMSNPAKYFKLKKNGKNYESEDYANCLMEYFNTSKSVGKLTMPDLHNVLGGLQALILEEQISETNDKSDEFQIGEHIIVVWTEDDSYSWELAVIESVSSGKVFASHFVPTKRNKSSWMFPEEAKIHEIEENQILLRKFQVTYHKSIQIRCSLSKELLDDIEKSLQGQASINTNM